MIYFLINLKLKINVILTYYIYGSSRYKKMTLHDSSCLFLRGIVTSDVCHTDYVLLFIYLECSSILIL
ncbi:hypothetical protein CoNPh35_CDS0045 [Staphylococcus phage S-CoN_Ph35]|nr:hypothetical protein CoNPh35_CDS0045 [Staphylococcus phage S-CoN_Ph35]